MIDDKNVVAIVPARGGSKGLPRKNMRLLGGKPLVAWPVAAAKEAYSIDRVIVSTDDQEIAKAGRIAGADIPFLRPHELAGDAVSSMAVVRHALEALAEMGEQYAYVVLLEPTSPLTEPSDIERALAQLNESRDVADSIVGISLIEATHPEYSVRLAANRLISPYSARDFQSLRRRQEIETLYFLEGSLYISAVDTFLQTGSFYHERTLGFPVPRWKSLEIDDYLDLVCVEAILQRRDEIGQEPRVGTVGPYMPNQESK